jgi:ankyrin repeat protein
MMPPKMMSALNSKADGKLPAGFEKLTVVRQSSLLEKVGPNARGVRETTPVMLIRDARLTLQLLKAGADVNARDVVGMTPLHHVVQFPDLLKMLLQYGANPNLVDEERWTPLHRACLAHCATPKSIQLLLAAGAKIDPKNLASETPLQLLISGSLSKAVTRSASLLVTSGAKVTSSIRTEISRKESQWTTRLARSRSSAMARELQEQLSLLKRLRKALML